MCTYEVIPHAGRPRKLIFLVVVMLVIGLAPAANAAIASFTADPNNGPAPLYVQFTDYSVPSGPGPIDNWTLDFDDGTPPYVTTESWPLMYHIYNKTGTFQAKLTVNESGYLPQSTTNEIVVYPNASFLVSPEDGCLNNTPGASLLVTFTDNSVGTPDMWTWDFGDHTPFIFNYPWPSINHSYTLAGKFEVEMTAYKDNHAGTPAKRNVTVRPGSNYTWTDYPNRTWDYASRILTFTDTSTGSPDRWQWYVNENLRYPNYLTQNLILDSPQVGKYNVTLIASTYSPDGLINGSLFNRPFTILPNVSFKMNRNRGPAPLGVNFTDTTKGIPNSGPWNLNNTTWEWTFGDGNISREQNPFYVFTKPGRFTVTLKVTCGVGSNAISNTVSQVVYVNTARLPPTRVSIYNTDNKLLKANKASIPSGESVTFYAYTSRPPRLTGGGLVAYAWYYGDGYDPVTGQQNKDSVKVVIGPEGWMTTHTYKYPGLYPVACGVVYLDPDPTAPAKTYSFDLYVQMPDGSIATTPVHVDVTVPEGYRPRDLANIAYSVVYMPGFVEVRG